MKWYNIFAKFYDTALEKAYRQCREAAVSKMNLKADAVVLDLACGTGQNFPHLVPHLHEGKVLGCDYSSGMLASAKIKIDKNQWKNITLLCKDAQILTQQDILDAVGQLPNHVICVLGFSVIPNWQEVLKNMWHILPPNGLLTIVDVYAEKRNFNTWLVEKTAQADVSRRPWEYLESQGIEYQLEYLPGSPYKYGGRLFLLTATKI